MVEIGAGSWSFHECDKRADSKLALCESDQVRDAHLEIGGRDKAGPKNRHHVYAIMADQSEQEKLMLLRATLRALGRALRHQPEFEQPKDVPEHMSDVVARLEKKTKPKNE